ncbi:MAG: hypothetical protein LBO69_08190 [Ignavibacteria bacterium]|jgi:mannose-1-phosphate guanylyltransferase|nr:hypothetical protein [Ignavibacteria bacterium]
MTKKQQNNSIDSICSVALLLVGGSGKKFWPFSNKEESEPFVLLLNEQTLYQMTYGAINKIFPTDDIWIVINEKYKHLAMEQIPELNERSIITEPLSRHTAPGVGLAMALLDSKYSDDCVFCIFPCDQVVRNMQEFDDAVSIACKAAHQLRGLITIGVPPTRPEINYGYIQYCEDVNDPANTNVSHLLYTGGLRKSINFAEKPDITTAERFIQSGDFVWNSGILVARKDVLFEMFEKYLNYHYEQFRYLQQMIGSTIYKEELLRLYKTFNKISLDYGILENAENVYVVKADFTWSDLNDWKELYNISLKDALDNVFSGNIVSLDTKNSLAISEDKLLAIVGMDDVVVVNTDKAILVCKKDDAYRIPSLIDQMKKRNIPVY